MDEANAATGRRVWGAEARATIALAWPLILTNLAQTAMTATDVVLMGWLGADALAAGALGSNLYFATMIFGLGLTSATAPMIARELGRKGHSVRDVRRTVRQGLWAAVTIAVPIWLILWHSETILRAMGQEPPTVKRILELNPRHALVTSLRHAHEQRPDDAELGDTARLLHGMALLAEGGELAEPAAFVALLSRQLEKSLS